MNTENLETTTAVILQMPRLIEKYGMDKTGEILTCITELFGVMGQHPKDVVSEAFATIVKIGNEANREDGQQCSVNDCDSEAACELLVEGSWMPVCEDHAKNRLMPRRGLNKP